jgi:hypothetical protein
MMKGEESNLQAKERGLRTKPNQSQHFDLGLPAPQTMRK